MNVFKDSFKALAIAVPLALAAPAATAKSPSPELSHTVENTRARVGNVFDELSDDLVQEVRFHLHVERCFVLNNKTKNAPEWLAAIGELDRVNDETAGKYDQKSQDAFERAKERLQTARAKAGVPFYRIMDGNRDVSGQEKACLVRKSAVRM